MPKIFGVYNKVKSLVGLAAKASANSADETGTAIDQRSYNCFNSGQVAVNVGAATGSPSSFSLVITLQESSDNSTWTTAKQSDDSAAPSDATVTITAAGAYCFPFNPSKCKRYLRVRRELTIVSGTSPTVPNGAMVQLGDCEREPVN